MLTIPCLGPWRFVDSGYRKMRHTRFGASKAELPWGRGVPSVSMCSSPVGKSLGMLPTHVELNSSSLNIVPAW